MAFGIQLHYGDIRGNARLLKDKVVVSFLLGFTANLIGTRHTGNVAEFVRKIYEIASGAFKSNPNKLMDILINATKDRIKYSAPIPSGIDPLLIPLSKCPFKEFDRQMLRLYDIKDHFSGSLQENISGFIIEGVGVPCVELAMFQWNIQQAVLYNGVKHVTQIMAPRYVSIVDWKIYTVVRILITAALYATYCVSDLAYQKSYVDLKEDVFYHSFLLAVGLGTCVEMKASQIAGLVLIINNIFWYSMRLIPRC